MFRGLQQLICIVIFLSGIVHGAQNTAEFPKPTIHETFVFAVSEDDLKFQIPFKNYPTRCSGGQCYGIDHVNDLLRSRIKFEKEDPENPGVIDSQWDIEEKIIKAEIAKPGTITTIFGFTSRADFLDKMKDLPSESNPLKRAIKKIQDSQPSRPLKKMFELNRIRSVVGRRKTNENEAKKIQGLIDQGIPVRMMWRFVNGLHQVTVVGYSKQDREDFPSRFFVFDPNHPLEIRNLYLNENSAWRLTLDDEDYFRSRIKRHREIYRLLNLADNAVSIYIDPISNEKMEELKKRELPLVIRGEDTETSSRSLSTRIVSWVNGFLFPRNNPECQNISSN